MNEKDIINKMKLSSHEAIKLRYEYLVLQARANFLKEKTENIKLEILKNNEFLAEDDNKRILEIKHDFNMSNKDFKTYMDLVREEQAKIGIAHENPDYCSQLVAENDLRKHETKIFNFQIDFLPKDMQEIFLKNEYSAKKDVINLFMKVKF